jgi:hypothetical protein
MQDGRRRLLGVLGALAALPATALGQVAPGRKVLLFNIQAAPLPLALQAYSAVTDNEVICDSRLAAGRRSSPVVGLFTAETALRILLDGTELTIRYTGPQDITLMAASASAVLGDGDAADLGGGRIGVMVLDTLHVDVPVGAERRPDFSDYGRAVRLEVKRSLAQDPETANRIFDLQIDIWINHEGRLRQPRLLQSTGRPRLDAAIRRVLEATVIKQPPPMDLPQPIRIAVVAI